MSNNEAIGFMGPYGAGKTESLATVGSELQNNGLSVRAIINDLGNAEADRSRMAARGLDLLGLNGGCVGCGDTGSFRRELARAADDGIDRLLFEAPATLHAEEVREEVTRFYPDTSIVAIWDALGHDRNYHFGPALQPATLADVIGLTKHNTLDNDQLAIIRHDLARVAMQSTPLLHLAEQGYGDMILEELARTRRSRMIPVLGMHVHEHTHTHEHDVHSHDHHHHGTVLPQFADGSVIEWLDGIDTVQGVKVLAKPFVSEAELRQALEAAGALRAKGGVVVGGAMRSLQYTPEQLQLNKADGGEYLYAYGVSASQLATLETVAESRVVMGGDATYKELIASHGDARYLQQLAHEKTALYPASIRDNDGMVMTDFGEADIAYQIAKQRTDIDVAVRRAAFTVYIQKRLEAARELSNQHEAADGDAWRKLRLGVVLAYHEKEYKSHLLSEDQRREINTEQPWRLLLEGLRGSYTQQGLNFDPKRRVAEENPELLIGLLAYGIQQEYCNQEDAAQAYATFKTQYTELCDDKSLIQWWSDASF